MVRGTEVSHHWAYGETFQAGDPPRHNQDKKKKKKKKNWLTRYLERIAEENKKNPPCCGCGSCK